MRAPTTTISDVPNQSSTNDFAMEEARAYLDFGVIPNRLSVYIDQRFAPGNSTNLEANIRYWITENSFYVKAGRMYLPFGYRFEDDNAFVRQLSGINMQAPDEGVEFGFENGSWTTQLALSNGTAGAPEVDNGKQIMARTEYVGFGLAHGRERGQSTTPTPVIAWAPALFGAFRAGSGHLARRGRLLRRRQHRRRGPQAHGVTRRSRLESAAGPQPQAHVRVAGARRRRRRGRADAHQPAVRVVAYPVHPACAAASACTTAFRRTTSRTGPRRSCSCMDSSSASRVRYNRTS